MTKTPQRRGTYGLTKPQDHLNPETGELVHKDTPPPAGRVVATNPNTGALTGVIGTTPEKERQIRNVNHLEDALATALRVVWARIQEGHFWDQLQAEGLVGAWQHLTKGRDLARKHMAQLSLPETSTREKKAYPVTLTPAGRAYVDSLDKEDAPRVQTTARTCRICGCTDDHACRTKAGLPCSWVKPDLCSACAEKEKPDPFDALGTGRTS